MYAKCKAWISSHLCTIIVLFALLAAGFLFSGRESIPSDGNRAQQVRGELESVTEDSTGIRYRVGEAEKTAYNIEESVERSGELAHEAPGLIEDCKRIIAEIRNRTEKNTKEDKK